MRGWKWDREMQRNQGEDGVGWMGRVLLRLDMDINIKEYNEEYLH